MSASLPKRTFLFDLFSGRPWVAERAANRPRTALRLCPQPASEIFPKGREQFRSLQIRPFGLIFRWNPVREPVEFSRLRCWFGGAFDGAKPLRVSRFVRASPEESA
jgi:hypothetical protein